MHPLIIAAAAIGAAVALLTRDQNGGKTDEHRLENARCNADCNQADQLESQHPQPAELGAQDEAVQETPPPADAAPETAAAGPDTEHERIGETTQI